MSGPGDPPSPLARMHRYPSTEPVVITCALTGGIHGKEANPNLPEQPDEIVAQGIAAAAAGAAIPHGHPRQPGGAETVSPRNFRELHAPVWPGARWGDPPTTRGAPGPPGPGRP